MSNQQNTLKQIIVGVSISVLSAFVLSKINLSKKVEIIVELRNPQWLLGASFRRCEDCRVIVTLENQTATFHMYKKFKLKLNHSKDDVNYQIQFTGTYDGKFYNETYTGKIPASDSHYFIEFIETKLNYSNSYKINRIYLKEK